MGLRNLTWLQSPVSRFYSVPAVLDKPCAYRLTTPFCLRAIVLQQADTCFAKGLAGTVSRRAELRAGQWCCRWCICCLLIRAVFHLSMRGAVGKIIHGHSGKRFLPWCTAVFLSALAVYASVAYHLVCLQKQLGVRPGRTTVCFCGIKGLQTLGKWHSLK